jgi:hypothetical protein
MSRFVDSIIAYKILRMLTTPFEETDAFRLGIVDAKGKELKRMRDLNSIDEKDAYTILHRMVFRLKRIIEKVPVENKKLASFAAALSLIKEHSNATSEPIDLEDQYLSKLQTDLTEDINFIHNYYSNKYLLPFKAFIEEAPANNAQATPGVAGLGPDLVVVRKRKKVLKRNEVANATSTN